MICVKIESNFAQKLLTTRQSGFQVQAVYFTFPIRIEISRIRIFKFFSFRTKKIEIRWGHEHSSLEHSK